MNEQPLTTESHAHESSVIELAEPHFDDIAIAIAQPVELLSSTNPERSPIPGILRRHISMTVLLFILCGAVGFGTVAFGWAGLHQQLGNAESQSTIIAESSQNTEIVETSTHAGQKNLSPHPVLRKVPPRVNTDSRPVARKVGEIR
jgi:hypothetical protein